MGIELSTKQLQTYVGGQAEIQNSMGGYVLRGDIRKAYIDGSNLTLEFDWLARGEGFPFPERWIKDNPRDYEVSLETYAISNISYGRTCLVSSTAREKTILFPKGGDRLELSNVVEK